MLDDAQVLYVLASNTPSKSRHVILSRLRRLPEVWMELQREDFLKNAIAYAGSDPLRMWMPGLLGLHLSGESEAVEKVLAATSNGDLPQLSRSVQEKAETAYHAVSPDGPVRLDQAALAALAIRSRPGLWTALPPQTTGGRLVSACLFGLLADTTPFVSTLAGMLPQYATQFLEILFSNEEPSAFPQKFAAQINDIPRISIAALSDAARAMAEPEAADVLGRLALNSNNGKTDDLLSDMLTARLYRSINEPASAVSTAEELHSTAKRILLESTVELAQAYEASQDPNGALAFWKEAQAMAQSGQGYRSGIARALSSLGRLEEAMQTLPSDSSDPEEVLTSAKIFLQKGNRAEAVQFARKAYALCAQGTAPMIAEEIACTLEDAGDFSSAFQVREHYLPGRPADAEGFLKQANCAAEIGDWNACASAAAKAWYLRTANTRALELMAKSAEHTGNHRAALEHYRILSENQSTQPEYILAIARNALGCGENEKAKKAVNHVLGIRPEDGEAYAILGRLLLEEKQDDKAFDALQKATRLSPTSPYPWIALSGLHMAKGNLDAAVTTLRAGADSVPGNIDVLMELGRLLADAGKYRDAAAVMERVLSNQPDHAEAGFLLGKSYKSLQRFTDMETALTRSLAHHPEYAPSVQLLSGYFADHSRGEEARKILQRALSAAPESIALLREMGAFLVRNQKSDVTGNGNPEELETAVSILRQAASLPGGEMDISIQLNLGWAQALSSTPTNAVPTLSRLLADKDRLTAEERLEALKGLAEALIRTGEFAASISGLQEAQSIAKGDRWIDLRLVDAYLQTGLLEDAKSICENILSVYPTDIRALNGLAKVHLTQQRFLDACMVLKQTAEIEPEIPSTWLTLAEAYLLAEDAGAARIALARAYEKSERMEEKDFIRTARLLSHLTEYTEAASVLETALQTSPTSLPILNELGEIWHRSGWHAKAHDVFRRASELEPQNPEPLVKAADALWEDGRRSAALAYWKKAVQLSPEDTELLRHLASSMGSMGLEQDALPYYERILILQAEDGDLALEAAQVAYRAGALEKAGQWKEIGLREKPGSVDGLVLKARLAIQKREYDEALETCNILVSRYSQDSRGWAMLAIILRLQGGMDGKSYTTIDPAKEAFARAIALNADSPEGQLITSEAALLLEDYDQALVCARSLHQQYPENADYCLLLAQSGVQRLESESRCQIAERETVQYPLSADPDLITEISTSLEKAISLGVSERKGKIWSARAGLVFAEPEPESISLLESIVQTESSSDLRAALALAWLTTRQPEKALSAMECATPLDGGLPVIQFLFAAAKAMLGELDTAIELLTEAIRRSPYFALAHTCKARLLAASGLNEEAKQALEKAVALNPNRAAWRYLLGTWQEETGAMSDALPSLQRAVELDPRNVEYRIRLARAFQKDGDPASALNHYRRVKDELPAPSGTLSAEIGKAALETGSYEEAVAAFQSAEELCGRASPHTWKLGRARAMLALGRKKDARDLTESVLNSEEKPSEARLVLAEIDEAEGDYEGAMQQLDRAASEMSDPVLPALRLARLWNTTGAAHRSVGTLQALLECDPENDEARHLLADALMRSSRMEEGLREAQKACELAPRKARHWELRAKISRELGQLDQALASLSKAFEISPDYWRIDMEKGLVYEAQKRWDLALKSYRNALAHAPVSADLHFRMGVVHKNLKAYTEAAASLKKAVQIEPHNLAAHRLLSGVMALSLVYGSPAPVAIEAR